MKTFTEQERRELHETLQAAAGAPISEPMPEFFVPAEHDGRFRVIYIVSRPNTPFEARKLAAVFIGRDPQAHPAMLIMGEFWLS
jgi:hypothetical protein